MNSTRRKFLTLFSMACAALGLVPKIPAVPKRIVSKATHEEMIGLKCWFNSQEYEVVREAVAGEKYLDEIVNNYWRSKFLLKPVNGGEPLMFCFGNLKSDPRYFDLAPINGIYFYRA